MSSLDRRRELNRVAAQKLRNKRKERAVNIRSEYFAAQSTNTRLSYELKQLERQKNSLEAELDNHLRVCFRNSEDSVSQSALQVSSDNKNNFTYLVQTVQAPYASNIFKQDGAIEFLSDEGSHPASMMPESSSDVISYSTQDIIAAQFNDLVYSQQISSGECPVSNDSFPIRYQVVDASSLNGESNSPDSSPLRDQTMATTWFKCDVSQERNDLEYVDDQSQMLPLCVSSINEQWSTAEPS